MPKRRRPDCRPALLELLEARIAPATFLVTNTNDTGAGSLRDAIQQANAMTNIGVPDVISFASIPASGAFVIQPLSPLPDIVEAVVIDGYSAPGTAVNTANIGTNAVLRVEIDASLQGPIGAVFTLAGSGGSTVTGMVLRGTTSAINGNGNGISIESDDNLVVGNFIGTDVTGSLDFGNRNSQVSVGLFSGSDVFTGNRIGGTALADRNILSGGALGISLSDDSFGTVIQGNLIGTDRTGSVAIPNNNTGIGGRAIDTLIGGSAPGAGNVISGNDGWGINFAGVNTTIQGNIIGLNAAGNAPLPNARSGINFSNGASTALVGGSNAGEGNVISGNAGEGIEIGSNFGDGSGDNITVRGNKIGTDATGVIAFGNGGPGIGVYGTSGAIIGGPNPGEGNVIAFNGGAGVLMTEFAGSIFGATVSGNSIASNAGLGIDLQGGKENIFGTTANDPFDADTGPNGLTNRPELGGFTNSGADVSISFSVNAEPGTSYRVEFFSLTPSQVDLSGAGEGAVFLGSADVVTDGAGMSSGSFFQVIALPANSFFSATLTNLATNETSEFSDVLGDSRTFTWTGAVSSDWFDAGNWNSLLGAGVPGPIDAAVFNGGANPILLDASASVLNFNHSAGAMTGAGELFVRNELMWTGGSQDGPGLTLVDGSTAILNSGAGPLQWTGGILDVFGVMNLSGSGMVFNDGLFYIEAGAVLNLNAGIIDQDGSATPTDASNFGTITKVGSGTFGIETTTVNNFSFIESRAGVLTLGAYFGSFDSGLALTGGGVSSATPIALSSGARLGGMGVITGSVVNSGGIVTVGIGEATGILSISVGYTQDASGVLEIGLRGTTPGTTHDQLAVGGTVALDGTLNVTVLPGYAPMLGSVHDVVSSTGRGGLFSSTLGIGALTANYTATSVQLIRNGAMIVWDAGAGGDTNWFNAQNWNPDVVPGPGDQAVLSIPATITLDAADAVVGDFIQNNGTLAGSRVLAINGSLVWSGGTQSGAGATRGQPGSSFVLDGGAKTLDARTLLVQGNGASAGASQLVFSNGGALQVGGVFDVQNTTPFQAGAGGGTLAVQPSGTLRKLSAGNVDFPAGFTFQNNGLLDVQNGSLTLLGDGAADDAIFRVAPAAVLVFNSATGFDFTNSITFEGPGFVQLAGGSIGGSGAGVFVSPDTTLEIAGGTFAANNHTLAVEGTLEWTGGSLTGTGTANVTGAINLSGAAPRTLSQWILTILPGAAGNWVGVGTLSVEQSAQIDIGGAIGITGGFDIIDGDGMGGALTVLGTGRLEHFDSDTTTIEIPVFNSGSIASFGGAFDFTGSFLQSSGALYVSFGATLATSGTLVISGGMVGGDGTISGSLDNASGVLLAGPQDGNTGALVITGNYTQGVSARLVIEALGNTAVTEYDQLQVGGTAMLDGALDFLPINLFNPIAPSTFNVLTSIGARTGTFNATNLPPGGSAAYTPNGANVVFGTAGIVVTNTSDSGAGSLRQAILDANAAPGVNTITFNIAGGGVQKIQPLTLLPVITEGVVIDGFSQPGASANTLAVGSDAVLRIEIDGSLVPNGAGSESGLVFSGTDALTVRGLVINAFDGYGIELLTGSGSKIAGNWIGPASDGGAFANSQFGIWLDDADGAIIGGTSPADRNVISNNDGNGIEISNAASGTIIQGNYIGTNVFGTAALPNGFDGVYTQGPNTQVGGTTPGAGNVISASQFSIGVFINTASAAGSRVEGNFIGTDATGMVDLGNFSFGVEVGFTPNVTIGGAAAGAGNIIAGNGDAGVAISGAGSTGVLVLGNRIGTDATGTMPLGNDGGGVAVFSASGATIGGIGMGEENVIAFNTGAGVFVDPGAGTAAGNAIRGNVIFANTGIGIDLVGGAGEDPITGVTPNDALDADGGANALQNFPVLTAATLSAGAANVSGSLHSLPGTNFRIDFYASPAPDGSGFGEGAVFLGDIGVMTNGSGDATFNFNPATTPPPPGSFITAIATDDATGDSSEFSAALALQTSFVWDGGGGADMSWFNPLNWDLDFGVPGPGDSASLGIASTIELTAPVTVGSFFQSAGTVTGGGDFTVNTAFTWSGGTLSGPATLVIPVGATLTLVGAGDKTLDRRFIDNDGTVTVTGIGNLSLNNGPMITNNGLWDFQSDADIAQTDAIGSLFQTTSLGTLRKSVGNVAGGTIIGTGNPNLSFVHANDLDVQAGNLAIFSSGGTWTSGSNLIVASGAKLAFNGGNFTWAEVPGLTGNGTLEINNGTFDLGNGGTLLVGVNFTLAQTGGTITGDGALAVGGTFDWSGGTLSGTGATTIFAGATWNLTTSTSVTLDGRAVAMGGMTNFTGSGTVFLNNGAAISNNVGTFLIAGDGDLAASTGTSTFSNQLGAIFRKTGGSADTDIGSASPTAAVNFTNAGTVEVQAGRFFFHDAFTQSAGSTILSGLGALATGSTLTFNGGELSGSGLITGSVDNTGATVRPGGTGMEGAITISGNYTQGAGGTLAVELNGTALEEFDALDVGTATLGGTLNIANLAGFTPAGGDMFRVVRSGNNPGTFASLTGATSGLSQNADATGLVLTAAVALDPLVVNTTLDVVDAMDAFTSLREAITYAETTAGVQTVSFNIPGAGPHVLTPLTPLPTIFERITIDGYTQPGASPNTLALGNDAVIKIQLSGALAGGNGLWLRQGNISIVRGLSITGFTDGIRVGFLGAGASDVQITGNWIGVAPDGTPAGNTNNGIVSEAFGTQVGGLGAAFRNVISANGQHGVFLGFGSSSARGNYIGTAPSGLTAMGNGGDGVRVDGLIVTLQGNVISGNTGAGIYAQTVNLLNIRGNLIGTSADGLSDLGNGIGISLDTVTNTTIGTSTVADRNIISGNNTGILLTGGSGNLIRGNFIGTDAAGTAGLGNTSDGLVISGSTSTTVGGASAGEGNTIAFNGAAGVRIDGATAAGNQVRGNSIHSNTGLGIDLNADGLTINDPDDSDTGANGLQNFPVITSAQRDLVTATISGSFQGAASSTLTLDFYSSPAADPTGFGEGSAYLGSTTVSTDGSGAGVFSFNPLTPPPAASLITATATDGTNNTSEFGEAVILGGIFTWDNSAGNSDWFNPLNWDRDSGVPGAADTAILNIASTISLTADVSVGVFQQSAGTLTSGAGITFTVLDAFDWTGGVQVGTGTTRLAAGSLSSFVTSSDLVFSRTIDNAGTVVWTGAANLRGQFGGTINNLDGGIFEVQTDGDFVVFGGAGSAVFNNAAGAIFRKTVATGTTQFTGQDFTFHNAGTVDMLAGTLALGFSGNHGGTFAGAAGTVIAFDAGQTFASGTQFTGAGEKRLNAGTHTLTGAIGASGLVLNGGVIAGTHTITGSLEWRAGEFGGGATTLPAGSTLTLDSSSALRAAGRTFSVEGSIVHAGTGAFRGALGTVIDVAAGGLYDLQTDGGFVVFGGDGNATFNNAGTLRKSGGAGTASFSNGGQTFALNNSGSVQVQSGSLLLAHAGTHSGSFDVAAGSTLTFQTNQTLNDGVQFSGAGRAQIAGGTTTASGTINTANLVLAAGTLNGVHAIVGDLAWEGGQIGGTTAIAAGSTLQLTGASEKLLNGGTINNAGTVLWQDSGNFRFAFGATFNNQTGGLFDIQNDATISIFGGSGSGLIANAGTLRKSGGAGTTAIGGGQGPDVTNSGTVEVQSGTLAFQLSFTQSAGETVLAGGNLGGGITFAFQGGELRGAGTIAGSVNNSAAVVQPGGVGAAGTIAITGGYTQGAGGMLEIELGGTGAGQFDVLDVDGTATLGGTLVATTIGGLTIVPPMSFAVVSYGSRAGTFTSSVPPGLTEDYQTAALVLATPVVLDPLVVNTTLDVVDAMDGFTSLREAIIFANGNAGLDTITFAIPGSGVQSIQVSGALGALPTITDPTVIDGYTQPGATANTLGNGSNAVLLIELDGTAAGMVGGFSVSAGGSTIRGLIINRFFGDGIELSGFGGNAIEGNFIGTNAAGTAALPNGGQGIDIYDGSDMNVIGGTTAAARNLVAGNFYGIALTQGVTGNRIEGNLIGTDVTGMTALGNFGAGVLIEGSGSNFVGGSATGARNVISGNIGAGILLDNAPQSVVAGNYIGTNVDGTAAIGNVDGIVLINGSSNSVIGGTLGGAGNVISGNSGHGLSISDSDLNTVQGNLIGLNASGTLRLANANVGIELSQADNNLIGGTATGARNIIASGLAPIEISDIAIRIANASGNRVEGNYIGTDITGTVGISPGGAGIGLISGANGNIIGGSTAGAGNVIAGLGYEAVYLGGSGTTGNKVMGNYIGVDAAGSVGIGIADSGDESFTYGGVLIYAGASGNIIGTDFDGNADALEGNVIAASGQHGVVIIDAGTTLNSVRGNLIGVDAAGLAALGNAKHGILIDGASGNTIGGINAAEANTIAFSTGNGITVRGNASGNSLLGNSIFGNTGLGIDLGDDGSTANDATDSDIGPNNLINFPVLTSAALNGAVSDVSGSVTTAVNGTVRVEFFLVSTGAFLGATDVVSVAATPVTFTATLSGAAAGDEIFATTSDLALEGTSEFSAAVTVIPPALISIGDAAIVEGNSGTRQLVFTLTLDMAVPATVTVDFGTTAFSGDARSAMPESDYSPLAGTVTFAPNQLTQTVAIDIFGDTASEATERFNVVLSNATSAGIDDDTGTGAIIDDDHDTFAVGAGSGNQFGIFTATPAGATLVQTIEAFTPGYKGGVRVAVGDVTGDGVDDFIAGAGLGGRAKVRVFDGVTFAPVPGVLGEFSAFGRSYRGGVFVAAGDVDGDGHADVIVTPSAGSSNRVNIFSGADGSLLSSFRAFGKGTGGVRVAAGDVNGDGFADVIAGTGVGSSVRVFDAMTGAIVAGDGHEFRAFGKNFRGGVYVAAGDLNADGRDDLIVGTGAGQPLVRTYLQGVDGVQPKTFDAYTGKTLRGVRVTALDIDADGIADIITSKGRKGDNLVRTFDGETFATLFETRPFASQLDSLYVG